MKRLVFFSLALVFILCGCSAGGAEEPDAPISEILEEMISETQTPQPLPIDKDALSSLYGIKADDVGQCACAVTMNGVFPDEMLIIKAKDAEAAGRIKQCLDTRLKEVLEQSRGYDAASYAVAQKCRVNENGLYLSLFVSAKHEEMNEIYLSHFAH